MKSVVYVLFCSLVLLNIIGCGGKKRTASGVEYTIHTHKGGTKVTEGSFVSLNMQYETKDTIIFTSYNKAKPLQFKFQKNLFNGMLNQGLLEMGKGDSATFWVLADSVYSQNMPRIVKKGDKIKYTVSVLGVQTQEEFTKDRKAAQTALLAADKQKIDAYLATHKDLSMTYAESGLAYKIDNPGSGESPKIGTKVKAKYKTSLLDGTVVNSSDGVAIEVKVNTQTRGVREALLMLKKGGKGTFIIPSALAYRDRTFEKIPSNSPLIYEVEVINISPDDNPPMPPSSAKLNKMGNVPQQKIDLAPNAAQKLNVQPNAKLPQKIELKGRPLPLKPAAQQPRGGN